MHRSKDGESMRKECLFPHPPGYKPPIRWLKSRDECWYRNVPYNWINKQKSNQHWLRKEGERFLFPGCGNVLDCSRLWRIVHLTIPANHHSHYTTGDDSDRDGFLFEVVEKMKNIPTILVFSSQIDWKIFTTSIKMDLEVV
ncbi:Encoded by [Trifolium repens]|nr:Encoded by [Trifolium repens]